MSLAASIIRRLLIMIPMLIGVTLLAFIVSHLVPSDPLVLLVSEKAMNNPEIVKAAVEKWGLDRSLPEQYFYYLGNLLQGNLGVSFKTRRPVAVDIMEYFPATVELGFSAMLFAIVFGLPLGIAAAIYSGKMDRPPDPLHFDVRSFDAAFLVRIDGPFSVLVQNTDHGESGEA